MTPVSRGTAAGRAYLDLKAKAIHDGRLTDELIQLYALEGFLARLAVSGHSENLILKGGVLLTAYGSRRPTRDIDLAARAINNDTTYVLNLMRRVATQIPAIDDGLVFDLDQASAQAIRDEDEYAGVRVSMTVALATARIRFHVDVNIGDPIWPAPNHVSLPRLLGGPTIRLIGYPLHMVHAEKIVTAVHRGSVNTRWRDFADIWTLARTHPVDGDDLHTAIVKVASHRHIELSPLSEVLQGYPSLAQAKWAAWRRKQKLEHLPADFSELLHNVTQFADPAIVDELTNSTWDPAAAAWKITAPG